MVEPGSILGGKYRVGRALGRGGMGLIVEAMHVQLGTHVAVKVLRADYREKPEVAERFLREARAAAQLRNEHICRVHDFGTLEDGAPFMVMELLEGRDLGTLVDQEGPLPAELVAAYLIQTCTGIAEPHAKGMIHRDLKPGNLFLEIRPDGAPFIKILDFGIAKFEQTDFKLTETKSVVGSPSYMAPEQLRSSKLVDTRTDIWALGVVMYELLTEKLPFNGDSMPELVYSITSGEPPPLPPSVRLDFAEVVMRCLEKDPDKRYQDVGALAEALEPFASLDAAELAASAKRMLAKKAGTATQALAAVDDLLAVKQTTLGSSSGVLVTRSPLPKATLGLAAALVVALGVILFLFMRHGDDPAKDEPAAHPVLVPDAAATVPRVDAAVPVATPVDAAEPDAPPPDAAEPPPDVAPVTPPTKKIKKHHGGTTQHPTNGSADLGSSRF